MTLGGHPSKPVAVDLVPGWTVWNLASTASTNDDLAAWAAEGGASDHCVLVADHQSAGRGRLARQWDAPPGENLLCSILLTQVEPQLAQHIVAISVIDAASTVADQSLALKWPNDVIEVDAVGEWRKVAGMLSAFVPDVGVIVGIGINLGWAPDGAARIVDPAGEPVDRWVLLESMLVSIDRLLALDPTEVNVEYRSHLDTLNRRVRVEMPAGETLEGRAIDVADSGELIVLDSCAITHRLGVGDVIHLRDG